MKYVPYKYNVINRTNKCLKGYKVDLIIKDPWFFYGYDVLKIS